MAGYKMGRTTEDIKREMTAILREMKDPRVRDSMISVVRVEVTNDLSYCSVYVSSMHGIKQGSCKGFEKCGRLCQKRAWQQIKTQAYTCTAVLCNGFHRVQCRHKQNTE